MKSVRGMYIHTVQLRVLYGHVDKMNIVYYGRYFEYFEYARNELLRSLGVPYTEIEKHGVSLPVIQAFASYKAGAKYDDLLTIESTIPEMPRARIRVEYSIVNADEKLLVEGFTEHSFVKSNGRPTRLPKILKDQLKVHF